LNATKGTAAHRRVLAIREELTYLGNTLRELPREFAKEFLDAWF